MKNFGPDYYNISDFLSDEELLIKQNQLKKQKTNIILQKIYKYSNKFSYIILTNYNNYQNFKKKRTSKKIFRKIFYCFKQKRQW